MDHILDALGTENPQQKLSDKFAFVAYPYIRSKIKYFS
jgi:hypothetical protein